LSTGDGLADGALAARICGGALCAAQGLGQDARGAGFPDAAGTGEQKRVVDPAERDGVREGARDVFLADQVVEALGSVFSGENEVRHGLHHGKPLPRSQQATVGLAVVTTD